MAIVATDTARLSNLVKHELWPETGYCRKEVTVNEATAKTYAVGTVLGKVTADGKYKIAVQTAVDGSAVAAAIGPSIQPTKGIADADLYASIAEVYVAIVAWAIANAL